ncbi:transporter [Micromonospora sp. NPDC049374]|uniref:transporter n=1 Tax=Micromonospora sp. NPDC049374 TaxID=3154352 RepID=UPI00343FE909
MITDDDLPPEDPAAALRLIDEQRATAARQFEPDPRAYYWPWGLAWLIGFGLHFLYYSPGDAPLVEMPSWLPLTTLFVLLAAAGAVTAMAGARAYGQVTGDSARRGAWYGWSWGLGFLSLFVLAGRLSDSLPPDLVGLLWSAFAVGLTGILHMAGGAIWLDRPLFLLGVGITVVNLLGTVAGPGWHALVVSVAGGGGMLLAGMLGWLRRRGRQ